MIFLKSEKVPINKGTMTLMFSGHTEPLFTDFDDVPVSTQTIITVSNLKFNLNLLYQYLPITPFIIVKKKRGRKKKTEETNPNQNISTGSIISVQYKTNIRGSILKESKKDNKTYFLNSITIVMILENNKLINSKISQNGKLQITGCKNMQQCYDMIKFLFKHIKEIEIQTGEKLFQLKLGSKSCNRNPTFIFNIVMKNIDFKVDFNINRELLNNFINENTNYCSLFESSVNTGVNIKIKSLTPYEENLNSIELLPDLTIKKEIVPFTSYVSLLDEKEKKEKKKESKKEKYHTFLVFHSGSIIQSGSGPDMKEIYNTFMNILLTNKNKFMEILNKHNNETDISETMDTMYNLKPGKKKISRNKNEIDLSTK